MLFLGIRCSFNLWETSDKVLSNYYFCLDFRFIFYYKIVYTGS
jgi:hypothetical protein